MTHAAKAQWNKRVGKSQMRTVNMGTFMDARKGKLCETGRRINLFNPLTLIGVKHEIRYGLRRCFDLGGRVPASTGAICQTGRRDQIPQGQLHGHGGAFWPTRCHANGRAPYDAKAAADNADVVATLSKLPWAAFGEGTDKGDTRAKPEIWKEAAKYKEAADKMQAEIVKLNTAAKAGNIDALKVAFGPAAASCKACHDNFRKD
jgi:cytochrome c556